MENREAYEFERSQRLHETRRTQGIVNRLTPLRWRVAHDDRINRTSVEVVGGLVEEFDAPIVLAVGAGGGGLLRLTWRGEGVTRIGVDINRQVLAEEGRAHFLAVEASGATLPIADAAVHIVLFDYVLHHLVGQELLEAAICEALRVLRPGGYIVAREPSAYSISGLALNLANRFRLMNLLTGSSNYEFALSPPRLLRMFAPGATPVTVRGLSFLWSRRLPPALQRRVVAMEPRLFASERAQWMGDFMLYVLKRAGSSAPDAAA